MANPPTFANVQLLLPLDGADGATSTSDVSDNALTITFHGNAQLDTAQSKFGGASLLLDGTDDYLRAALSGALMQFGTGDFTVEAWIRTSTSLRFIFDTGLYTGITGRWALSIGSSGRLTWWYTDSFGDPINQTATSTSIATGAWVHVAACRSGTTLRLFVDGAVVGTFTSHTVDYASAETHLYIGEATVTGAALAGHIDDARIVAEAVYTAAFDAPTTPHGTAPTIDASIAADGPLQAVMVLAASTAAVVAVASPLAPAAAVVRTDFTGGVDLFASIHYVMDLITPSGVVRVPISSWQATLNVGRAGYGQAVIPAAEVWVDNLTAATQFVVSRVSRMLTGETIEAEMTRTPADYLTLAQGPNNYTATIYGYPAEWDAVEDPPVIDDRVLQGIRSQTVDSSGTRVRCAIDWVLRPGQRAYAGETEVIVGYINYYVVTGADEYMDIGERVG